MTKFLDDRGLQHLWQKIKTYVGTSVSTKADKNNTAAGTYNSVTVNDQGIVTAGTNPTTLSGYGITDAKIDNGVITLGDNTISNNAAAQNGTDVSLVTTGEKYVWNNGVSSAVTNVAYNSSSKKLTKTINGTTSDIVAVSTLKSAMSLNNVENKSSATIRGEITSSNVTTALGFTPIPSTEKGSANGVCPLNANTKIDSQYLPSYVDDVVEVYARSGQTALGSTWLATGSASGEVVTPESGVIYILMSDVMSGSDIVYSANSQFRWGGTAYVQIYDGGISSITNAEIDSITAN